jgi:hypothetical protein
MPGLNIPRARDLLQRFEFKRLFIEELGWGLHKAQLPVSLAESNYSLNAIAEKRGLVVYHLATAADTALPDYATRRKIEQQVTRSTRENLIVYTDAAQTVQIWQWVRRQLGQPAAAREHHFHKGHSGDALLQRLKPLFVSFEEEESVNLVDVAGRVRRGFDVERVTKRFYELFRKEKDAFTKFITGIAEQGDREWYASVMLNRLMFVYFVQRKGFLDGDHDYLRNRLRRMQQEHGRDKFYSFYRYFLLRLFHEGLGGRERTPELDRLIGRIPYLNGGIFDIHELEKPERYGKGIKIPDKAFESIFEYFDQYQWHLDERPLRADNEINPDVLGYIFEKYINQKQMGAYYTKEDITGYISKNTVLPFLFDTARAKCKVAFENPAGPSVWDLLKNDPDRYIYAAVRQGMEKPLPPAIAKGLDASKPKLIERRKDWNKAAPSDYALPTEIWREVVARRQWYEEVRKKLASGEARDINDLITLNLDIRQFAQDVVEGCEGPELLRAFWHAIEKVTVLDPTCGSGAFLFAALNILEPLYEACLDRMEGFLRDEAAKADPAKLKQTEHGYPLLTHGKFEDFSSLLERVAGHPSRRYFVFKSIILQNLFGVDIMEEAVEICKLRLFLKLAAQVEPDKAHPNLGIEPLPDIDFNIRAGNTLVGYATANEVRRAFKEEADGQGKLMLGDASDAFKRFEERVEKVDRAFKLFRRMQTEQGMDAKEFVSAKQKLRNELNALDSELNHSLAQDYGIEVSDKVAFGKWAKSHFPFHWFVEFYGIVSNGGFDVIIGNPPYVEWNKIEGYRPNTAIYTTLSCGNIYTAICERSYSLIPRHGRFGMIVPVSCAATDRMRPLRDLWSRCQMRTHASFYSGDAHPSVLFNGVKFRLAILLQEKGVHQQAYFSTHFQRWYAENRESLFPSIQYTQSDLKLVRLGLCPKVCSSVHYRVLSKLCSQKVSLGAFVREASRYEVYSHRIVAHFVKAMDFVPYFCSERDGVKRSEDYKIFGTASAMERDALSTVLNSSLFYQWFVTYSDVYHCGREIILDFPLELTALAQSCGAPLRVINTKLMGSFRQNSVRRKIPYQRTGMVEYDEFYPKLSKPIIDEIDRVLARHYGFTEEELDFIVNYDIKYRLGRESDEDDDDE